MKIFLSGANRGLGLALTMTGLEKGHTLLAGVRHPDGENTELSHLKKHYPNQLFLIKLDVTDENDVKRAAKVVENEYGAIDVLINNAGVLLGRDETIEQLNMDNLEKTFDTNLFGPIKVVKHFLPLLIKGESAKLLNISSEAGSSENAYGGDYSYALSKSALNMFSKQMREFLKEKGIPVYAIHPGWIKTDMGGEQAPGSPHETSVGIYKIIEGIIKPAALFIDFKGKPMPL